MSIIGQADDDLAKHRITLTREAVTMPTNVAVKDDCRWCGSASGSRYARADVQRLPCRAGSGES